ncbi:hypothetical protein GH714_030439 [Hevea brasiliensis]|uniref:Uncharacterized protein n=1 Tax=Hevea brasiliensis TaxID=3981 RepID=A0A6A6LNA2_HEVBR|nr:hypothetical protein GH714_030439 [Hevea brasiliensis]
MHKVLILFFIALSGTPCTHSLEGTLLGRFFFALQRLLSPQGMLSSNDTIEYKLGKLKAA